MRTEPNLEEVAYQHGLDTRAAREYLRIAHAIRMLNQCHWWELYRKYKIRQLLTTTIKTIDNDHKAWQ